MISFGVLLALSYFKHKGTSLGLRFIISIDALEDFIIIFILGFSLDVITFTWQIGILDPL